MSGAIVCVPVPASVRVIAGPPAVLESCKVVLFWDDVQPMIQ